MDTKLNYAIQLRDDGKNEEWNQVMVELVKEFPRDPQIQYLCAWSYDRLGKETEAVPHYETAIAFGLTGDDLEGAYLGLGSTYRTLGKYEQSKEVIEKGMEVFPHNHALKAFYAMTLYNLSAHEKAIELLLRSLVETTNNVDILRYKKAILFYSDKLDETWV
ncbi:tetratricopeptide repeat protein [Robertmurraya kyonggiensis]|uniref:Tetratricopeptide repeat protein n=1 Tax=Robertmurraya kyonggiensis TaxID=1037680 RepID=A0A4U1D8A5_9BACI|nr:tetratricopeptide repeat protein [Robertmurraya kyonggiensis]TKC18799.1 tetratricopeptide repeat protein [Robertmurraya kyonggiensis]